MRNKIELSIVIPVFNVEKYLEECLKSVYKITGISKEIIIVNDGSTDNSDVIINKFLNLYPDETVVETQSNKGQSAARNVGVTLATGDYILFLDSDDTFVDHTVFELLRYAQKHDLDLLQGRASYFGDVPFSLMPMPQEVINEPISSGISLLKKYCEVASIKNANFRPEVWLMLLKRALFTDNNIRFTTDMYYEDELITPALFLSAKKVKALDLVFYNYRIRQGSIIRSFSEKHIASKGRLVKEYYLLLSKNKFYDSFTNNRLIGWSKEAQEYLSIIDLLSLFLLHKYKFIDLLLLSVLCLKSVLRFGKKKSIERVLAIKK